MFWNQILHGWSVAVFWLSNVQKNDHLNLEECTRQLTRMITNALRLCCNKLNPACLRYDSKPAKLHKARWAIQLLNHLRWTAKSGKFTLLSRAIKRSEIHLEVLSLQNRISFDYFLCFHWTLGIFPRDLEGFKADIAFIYTTLADDLNFNLTFVTRNFIGSCVIRCAFWLVSRKDDCLERVLRKSSSIKKSINKIPFICRINFENYFIKAIEIFFPVRA